jgi:hypothetical protein
MWPKIIDEMIAGLPTNSAQRLELEKLRLKSANDDALIKQLKSQIEKLTPSTGVDAEAAQVLLSLAKGGGELSCYEISDRSGIRLERVKRHLGYLRNLHFARWAKAKMSEYDPPHSITDAGNDFLYKNGML